MSRFNHYARELDEIARGAIEEYARASGELMDADAERKKYPERHGIVTAEYAEQCALAKAKYYRATQNVEAVKKKFAADSLPKIQQMRDKLKAEVTDAFSTKPEQVDAAALELLKSGIMNTNDYSAMLQKALADDNITMARLIAKYADDAAETRMNDPMCGNDATTAELRSIANEGRRHDGSVFIDSFNFLTGTLDRCMDNPAMMGHWAELTGSTVEAF